MGKQFFCSENNLIRYNTGISIIRLVMSFIVVKDHFGVNGNTMAQQLANKLGALAVPCFIFVSFYLTAEKLDNNNPDFLKKRLIRLEGPVIGWTIIYYLLFSLWRKDWQDWKSIVYGIIYGTSLNPPLWFLSSQIIILAGIAILYYIFSDERQRKRLLFILFVLAFFLQYTGINEYLYSGAPDASRYTLGRVMEIIPIAVSGIFYCKYENVINSKKYGQAIMNCFLFIFAAIGSFFPKPGGYGYSGFSIYTKALFICVLMISLPHIKSNRVSYAINYIAQFTMGIFCMHIGIGRFFRHIETIGMLEGTLYFDFVIWISCMFISLLLALLSKKFVFLKSLIM